nr:AAA family ATPase [uncultured Actinoplanes sp.]
MADTSPIRTPEIEPAGTTPVRGREAEITVIDRLLSALRAGEGGVLVLDGPAGTGKSRLSLEIVHRAERARVRVLRAEATRGGAAPLTPLLAATLGANPPVADAEALRALSEGVGTAYWLLHDLRCALMAAAEAGPLVIVLDDLQWADADTAAGIRTLVAGLRQVGVLWVLAVRRNEADPVIGDLLAHLEDQGAEVLRLGALTPAAGIAVIEDIVRVKAAPQLLEMARRVDAHPYPCWLTELVRGLRDEGRLRIIDGRATVSGTELPRRIGVAVDERLQALSPRSRQVVRVAALLPPSFTAAQLAGMVTCRPCDLIEPLDEAVRADLLVMGGRQIRFRQALLREAARESLPASLRHLLERESVDVLLRTGTDPVEVARMLARAAEPGDRDAIETLRTATEAIATADPSTAADLSVRTLELVAPDDAERGPVVVSALTHLHRAMRLDEASAVAGRALADMLPAEQEAAVRLTLATAVVRPAPSRAQENRAALVLRGVAPRARTEHRGWLAFNLMESGDPAAAERHARQVIAEAGDDTETTAMARLVLAAVHCARGDGDEATAELDRLPAPGTGQSRRYATVLDLHTANLLHYLGRTAEGAAALTDGLRRARRDHDAPLLALGTELSAMVNLMTGRLDLARAAVEAAGTRDDDAPVTIATVMRMGTRAALAQHLGDTRLGRAAITTARRLRVGDCVVGRRWAHRVLAAAAAARGDAAYAVRLLADDPLLPSGPPLVCEIGTIVLATWAALATGDRAFVERVADAAGRMRDGGPALAAAAEYIHGLIDGDPEQLLSAARRLAAVDRPMMAALATEDAGNTLVRAGHPADGAVHLKTALDVFTSGGAVVDAQRVKRSLRAQGSSRRLVGERSADGWASLTDSELKVVRLIAAGATNRTAAEQLFLSPHTVSAHVRSVFAKLGITSRVQLANVLRDNDV